MKGKFDRRLLPADGDAEDFATRFREASVLRTAIADLLTKEIQHGIIQSEAKEVLDSPNALAVLADLHGYRRGLRFALKLLTNQE